MKNLLRLLGMALLTGIAWLLLQPTFTWYKASPEAQEEANRPLEAIGEAARASALADVHELTALAASNADDSALPENLAYFSAFAENLYKKRKQPLPGVWSPKSVLRFTSSRNEVLAFAEESLSAPAIALKEKKNKAIKLGLDLAGGLSVTLQADFAALSQKLERSLSDTEKSDAMNSALEIIKSRADQFGATEPVIRRQGSDQILVELPGEKDPDAVNRLTLGKGSLSFLIEDRASSQLFNSYFEQNPDTKIDEGGRPQTPGIVPDNIVIYGQYEKDRYGADRFVRFVALKRDSGMDGSHIKNVGTSVGELGQPSVTFSLDAEGARIFGKLTAENTNEPLAVVMENKVKSVANINEPITGGAVSVTGFNAVEAQALATVLKSASLPVELETINLQRIGPSLGEETISVGLKASVLGIALVFAFTLLYYHGAGIIASFMLLLNILFTLALLSSIGFTLTLTSLAGLVLNIGMAVDANVLIFERIKDERRLGKSRQAAIEAGYGKARRAVLDANITTLIAAVFLSQSSSGPIKGFAVTLSIGIFTTLLTAVGFSKIFFDIGTENLRRKKISIGWGGANSAHN